MMTPAPRAFAPPRPYLSAYRTGCPWHIPGVTHSPASVIGRFPQKMKLIATAVILSGRALIDIERRWAPAGRVMDVGRNGISHSGRRLTESRADRFVGPSGFGLGASAAWPYTRSRAGRPCHSPPRVTHSPKSVIGSFGAEDESWNGVTYQVDPAGSRTGLRLPV